MTWVPRGIGKKHAVEDPNLARVSLGAGGAAPQGVVVTLYFIDRYV